MRESRLNHESMEQLSETAERLEALAEDLEHTVDGLADRLQASLQSSLEASLGEQIASQIAAGQQAVQENIGRITATVETAREVELERRLEAAEARLAELTAAAATTTATTAAAGRKTVPAGTVAMLAKQGLVLEAGSVGIEAAALDTALASLSIEQRIAVKAELLRAGVLR